MPADSDHWDVLIVGAGHAGAQLAIALRQGGFSGRVALLGDEPDPPYERPPLSKAYLIGEKALERILLRPLSFWEQRNITLRRSTRVVAVDPAAHRVVTAAGESIEYGQLVWATGGTPRLPDLPGIGLPGILTLRTRADADALRELASRANQFVIVGGGYIGLEAAASLRKLGKRVVLLEALPRVLARVTGEVLSTFIADQHRAQGVIVRTNVTIEALEGQSGVSGVRLAGGEVVPADAVLMGIGIVPAVQALVAAGARESHGGVLVDEYCRTGLPDIFAIGDCAAHASPWSDGAVLRLESVQNANDQATAVARTLNGRPQRYDSVPWFWSDQYDLKLQTVGLSTGHDTAVVRGSPASRSFSIVYLKRRRVIALDCINSPRDFIQGKSLVVSGIEAEPAALANTELALGALARQAG